jgi:hypothetical protein
VGKNSVRVVALAALAVAMLTVLVPNAGAENSSSTGPVTPAVTNRCGSGYAQVDSENLNALGPNFGVVYLFYNSANGNNCVFTEKLVARGTPTYTSTFVCRNSDGVCKIDGDNYLYYAGPRYLYARGQCVKWGGGVSNTDGRRDYFESGWEHCG